MSLEKFKLLGNSDIFQGQHVSYSAVSYAFGTGSTVGAQEALVWYYVSKTGTTYNTNDLKNLYYTAGIAREDDDTWFKDYNLRDKIRAGDMLIATIPQSACSTYIQGSTLEINVPTGTGSTDYTTFFGSSNFGYDDQDTGYHLSDDYNPNQGENGCSAVWLYRNVPYTGTVNGGRPNPNSGITSWTGANMSDDATIPHVFATALSKGDNGYDVPEGVALLERGIICIFDNQNAGTTFVSSEVDADGVFTSTAPAFLAYTFTGGTAEENTNVNNRRQVSFYGSNSDICSRLTYRPVNVEYKTIYFCHAGQNEFNSTSNHTYNHRKAFFRPMESDSIYVTEIGLYGGNDELIAYGKLSEPVEKSKLDTLTIKVELKLQ